MHQRNVFLMLRVFGRNLCGNCCLHLSTTDPHVVQMTISTNELCEIAHIYFGYWKCSKSDCAYCHTLCYSRLFLDLTNASFYWGYKTIFNINLSYPSLCVAHLNLLHFCPSNNRRQCKSRSVSLPHGIHEEAIVAQAQKLVGNSNAMQVGLLSV